MTDFLLFGILGFIFVAVVDLERIVNLLEEIRDEQEER